MHKFLPVQVKRILALGQIILFAVEFVARVAACLLHICVETKAKLFARYWLTQRLQARLQWQVLRFTRLQKNRVSRPIAPATARTPMMESTGIWPCLF